MTRTLRAAVGALAIAAACAGIANITVFGAKPTTTPNTPVNVTFRNASLPPDRLLSDAVSPSYTNGYTGVSAVIDGPTGRVDLMTCTAGWLRGKQTCVSQGRGQTFDFRDPFTQYFAPPYPTTTQGAHMQIWIFADDGATQLANGFRDVMHYVGEQRRAGSKINFFIDGTLHTVRFTPNFYASSDYLLVTYGGGSLSCTTADPSKCATWTVETSLDYGDIAGFVTGDNSKDYGQFHMPFRITVSVLPK